MTTGQLLFSAWDWEPSVLIGCVGLAAAYLLLVSERSFRETAYFLGGVLLLLLDLVSPIDTLGDGYLFSAHVAQHFLLALIIPVLFLLGLPRRILERALAKPRVRLIERAIGRPPVSWILGVGTMLVWHIPFFFNTALENDGMHIFQHLSCLVTGTMFWWPILSPLEERRLTPLSAISSLFTACTACSLLGAVLTFTSPGAYATYLHPADRLGALRLLREGWGLDPKSDQQLGGMLMWVPGCFVYLAGILNAFTRWHKTSEQAEHA